MPKMSERMKKEMAFFINDKGYIQYNQICNQCERECKQSFRAELIACPLYKKKEDK